MPFLHLLPKEKNCRSSPLYPMGISKVNPMAVQCISIEESSKRADEELYSFKKKHKEKRSNHAFE
jgi:hypothetical protein